MPAPSGPYSQPWVNADDNDAAAVDHEAHCSSTSIQMKDARGADVAPVQRSIDQLVSRLKCGTGVRAVYCMDEATDSPVPLLSYCASMADAWQHCSALLSLLSRARAVVRLLASTEPTPADESSDGLVMLQVRTKLDVEYLLVPQPNGSHALAVVQGLGAQDRELAVFQQSQRPIRQMMESSTDWLFGAADE